MKEFIWGVVTSVLILGVALFVINTAAPLQPLGAVSGPDIYSPYVSVNGVTSWYYRAGMTNASTTCQFRSPPATTTLALYDFTAQVTLAPTTTPQFELGYSTSNMATTSRLALHTFTAGTLRSIVSTTTPTDALIAPNTWFAVKQGGGGGSFVPTGVCQLTLKQVL